jgi:hypothetical protein
MMRFLRSTDIVGGRAELRGGAAAGLRIPAPGADNRARSSLRLSGRGRPHPMMMRFPTVVVEMKDAAPITQVVSLPPLSAN